MNQIVNLKESLKDLIDRQVEGETLERAFYVDENIFQAELQKIWYKEWLFVAMSCELKEQ